ncbi:MAG: MBOAT family protein [Pseudomonadota bacterium]
MLFNSFVFIFAFLPVTFGVFFLLGRSKPTLAAGWLGLVSIFFYGWWSLAYVPLLLASIVFNFFLGGKISVASGLSRKHWLTFAIVANLALLGYYKYANFFVNTANALSGIDLQFSEIILPLGISFFTFTQIAFLADTYRGEVKEYRFVHYLLFVTYFPHLIAGPVLHHKEMMPQFNKPETYRLNYENIAVGLTIFVIGLSKKLLLADNISPYVGSVFTPGTSPTLFAAWAGALAYTMQIYFDFSGYSDMAIGLSRLFGIKLPLNFNSPYQAVNIIEFWRRWHMTLSRFLRDYLYIPLGGNRGGPFARHRNLMLTMLLGGLWHGAGWTFVIWGGLHGLYLVINHAWRHLMHRVWKTNGDSHVGKAFGWLITFIAVIVAWVFFRAPDVSTALNVLQGMIGLNGIELPQGWGQKYGALAQWLQASGVQFTAVVTPDWVPQIGWTMLTTLIALLCLNTQQILAGFEPALDMKTNDEKGAWQPSIPWAVATSTAFVACLLSLNQVSEFLYFQF